MRATVELCRLSHGADLPPPRPATDGAAGFDLRACVDGACELAPGDRALVPTGVAIALPSGYEAQVRPRSGLAWKHGVTVANAPGTIDSDYRGEISVILVNLGRETYRVERGHRIAQLVVQRLPEVDLREVDTLDRTTRGGGGFGHTGIE